MRSELESGPPRTVGEASPRVVVEHQGDVVAQWHANDGL